MVVLPDPGKSQSFLDNLTFSRLTGGLQPKLVSVGWVLGLGRNCPPVAAALTHWARTRGLWQRSHQWRPQWPTTTHPAAAQLERSTLAPEETQENGLVLSINLHHLRNKVEEHN